MSKEDTKMWLILKHDSMLGAYRHWLRNHHTGTTGLTTAEYILIMEYEEEMQHDSVGWGMVDQ